MENRYGPVSPRRDYAQEMRELVDAATEGQEGYLPIDIAERIVIQLRDRDPELLHGWLHLQAVAFVRDMINTRDRSRRAYVRLHSGRHAFTQAVEAHEAGDPEALNSWLNTVYPTPTGRRKRLRAMGAPELEFAADRYDRIEVGARFMKLFLRAIAKQVGEMTVEERYTEEELRTMWNSLAGPA